MLAKSRNFKHGNVAVQPLEGSAHSIERVDKKLPVITSFNLSRKGQNQSNEPVKINTQKKVEPFDTATGIISNSPEIVSFSGFIPAFDATGNLNEFGNLLQVKQDAILTRAARAIENIASQQEFLQFKPVLDGNAETIKSYCEAHGINIDELLSHFSLIRSKLDFRRIPGNSVLKEIGLLPPDIDLTDPEVSATYANRFPLGTEEILSETQQNIKNWTPTKVWLQSCAELKEILANGLPSSFLADGGILEIDPANLTYYDPFSLVGSRSASVKKFGFGERQALTYPIGDMARANIDNVNAMISTLTAVLDSNDTTSSVFNSRLFSDVNNIEESIAKLSHILCKEYVYSTRFRSDVLADYGYPFVFGGRNVGVWNHLIGQNGADVTDIPVSPLGGGKSLVSLSQVVEPEGTEVLSFEDRYINDNVGTVRPNVVMTPGTFYYLESSISPTSNGFDVSRINRYLTRLNSATNMLRMVREDLMFEEELPFSSVVSKITGDSETDVNVRATRGSFADSSVNVDELAVKTSLSNPIRLLRHIENSVLQGSGLLRREAGPKLWTNKNYNDIDPDVSALIVSLALEKDDAELQAMLFLHQIYSISSDRTSFNEYNPTAVFNPSDTIIKSQLVDKILEKIGSLLGRNVSTLSRQRGADEATISLSVVKEALLSTSSSPSLKILNKIGKLLSKFNDNFDSKNPKSRTGGQFFLDQARISVQAGLSRAAQRPTNIPVDKKSSYSGVQKTNYLAAIFKLCCLMVHAANPERLTSIRSPNNKYTSDSKFVITKVRKATTGVLLSSDKINSGLSTINIQENFETLSLSTNPVNLPMRIDGVSNLRRLDTKSEIRVFELPTLQTGLRVYDVNVTNKNFRTVNDRLDSDVVTLYYDDVVVKCEHLLSDYHSRIQKTVDKFYSFVYDLRSEYLRLKNNLQLKSNSYGRTLDLFNRQMVNPTIVRAALSEEQLTLVRSRMYDISTRLTKYVSPVRNIVPHFLNLQNNDVVEYALPLEDLHLVSWNLLLKQFLREEGLRQNDGANKKIISIGLPQKIQRRMRLDASNLKGAIKRSSLLKVNVYRVNVLKPEVIYKPLEYVFDTKLFPTKVLSNYIAAGYALSESDYVSPINEEDKTATLYSGNRAIENGVLNLPFLKVVSEFSDGSSYIKKLLSYSDFQEEYRLLSSDLRNSLQNNHAKSLLLEEYLRIVTDFRFDENKFHHYGTITAKKSSKFQKFISDFSGLNSSEYLTKSSENFFQDDTLFSDVETTIRSIILPKKFDRVFHVILDPDDFEVDQRTSTDTINKYAVDGDITRLSRTFVDEPTFDKFYVSFETLEEGAR